jgi:hypothetical protein
MDDIRASEPARLSGQPSRDDAPLRSIVSSICVADRGKVRAACCVIVTQQVVVEELKRRNCE